MFNVIRLDHFCEEGHRHELVAHLRVERRILLLHKTDVFAVVNDDATERLAEHSVGEAEIRE